MTRTSETHPLRIDTLSVGPGLLGLTLCPGKKGPSVFGEPWARDLKTDIQKIEDWGADWVVTLMESQELDELGVAGLGTHVKQLGMRWVHLPIPDLGAPGEETLKLWERLSPELHQALDASKRVLIHCRGGLGRAGTLAALVLIERGDTATEAMERVRAVRPGAIETQAQERFLADKAALPDRYSARVRAALFGCAIGDALGAEIEFWNTNRILARFPNGVDEILPHDGRIGAITDDTQMTLFTAEGAIRAILRAHFKGICYPPGVIHHALLRWLVTQDEKPATEVDDKGLVEDPRLHRRRAPGSTCLSALRAAGSFGKEAKNDSKGCGTIMRVAPIAFLGKGQNIFSLAMESSALTHGHATAQEAAAAWAAMLSAVLYRDEPLEHAAQRIPRTEEVGLETARAIEKAIAAPRDGRPETVASLGEGWIAEEALSIALYACLCATNLETGLRIAVTHSGDSDSTGAIAGTMLGLLFPEDLMAHPWRRQVEAPDLINRLALDLSSIASREEQGHDAEYYDRMFERYPGW